MPALSDEELCARYVLWPRGRYMNPARMRETLNRVQRFIDFDQTIMTAAKDQTSGLYRRELYPHILGIPTREFLAEEPYIIQSWAGCDWNWFLWELYVETNHLSFSLPEMVIGPPAFEIEPGLRFEFDTGKDFRPFRITGKIIIDDMFSSEICAPGCVHLQPRQNEFYGRSK